MSDSSVSTINSDVHRIASPPVPGLLGGLVASESECIFNPLRIRAVFPDPLDPMTAIVMVEGECGDYVLC